MREIKFRAWFPAPYYSEPHMAYSPTSNDADDFGGRSSTWDLLEVYQASENPGNPIYMQFTGLKDKNGQEIYEGDVVNAVAKNEYKKNTRISDVILSDDLQWQVRSQSESGKPLGFGLPLTWGGWDGIEVIGNIYQNEELNK